MTRSIILLCCIFSLFSVSGFSESQSKKKYLPLTAPQLLFIDSLRKNIALPECGNTTLFEQAHQQNVCPLAMHMNPFIEWLTLVEPDKKVVEDQVYKRMATLKNSTKSTIDTAYLFFAGKSDAPITVLGYVNSTCPLCKFVTMQLYTAVTTGELAGIARLAVKPIGDNPGNIALMVAGRTGKFWEYFTALSTLKTRYTYDILIKFADSLGVAGLQAAFKNNEIKSVLITNDKERKRNGVTIVPTYFINNVFYASYKDPRWIIDAIVYVNQSPGQTSIRRKP